MLRLAHVEMAASVRITGRVPHEFVTEGSRWSRTYNWVRRLGLRGSSPKTGFVVLEWERVPTDGGTATADGVPRNGFRLQFVLHPFDTAAHFERSLVPFRRGDPRVVAVATPAETSDLTSHIRCFLVETLSSAATSTESPDGSTVVLQSADPRLSPDGNEWTCRRKAVPADAMWLICEPEAITGTGETEVPAPLESPAVRRRRWKRMWCWPLRYLGAVAILVAYTTAAYYLITWSDPADEAWLHTMLQYAAALSIAVVYWSVIVIVALQAVLLAYHALAWLAYERLPSRRLHAGTTECINDADLIRNGHAAD